MLRIAHRELSQAAAAVLASVQALVNSGVDYPARVRLADEQWDQKTSTQVKVAAFRAVRATLSQMCIGSVRCGYCEDSLAEQVEHILPKSLHPDRAFDWHNYLYACGPCNRPKSNRYGVVRGSEIVEFMRRRSDPIVPPPQGDSALINPRIEDPLDFLELDLGGVTPDGDLLEGTFELLPRDGLSLKDRARAQFTIKVVGLNREVIRVSRANAMGGFRARLHEYVQHKERGSAQDKLETLRDDILMTPHLTVFAELRRQRNFLPEIDDLFARAPEATTWPLIPG